MTVLSPRAVKAFQKTVYDYYANNKRTLPWRNTKNPYHILISEVMLQQTQVSRGLTKYPEFLAAFPTIESLARAPLSRVLQVWQGLGYNRRALLLHKAAQTVVEKYGGKLPRTAKELVALPGVGPTTAAGILNFTYGDAALYLETNVRSVYLHHFFNTKNTHGKSRKIHDRQLLPLLEQTQDYKDPRNWYYALLDYGVYLKKQHKNPSRASAHYTKQSAFVGSNRQVRSTVLRFMLEHKTVTLNDFSVLAAYNTDRIRSVLQELEREGFIIKRGVRYSIKNV